MIDMKRTILAKSDQLNADDLMAGPITIKVTSVRTVKHATADRDAAIISFEGDGGKPFKPCLSMCRILTHLWGDDGAQYVGRSMTLYRDPSVRFGGDEVGGIRLSHMSDIDGVKNIKLTFSRGKKQKNTIKPLLLQEPKEQPRTSTRRSSQGC